MEGQEKNLQDIMGDDLFAKGRGEMAETLSFFEKNGVPLTTKQLSGVSFLKYLDRRNGSGIYAPIANAVMNDKKRLAQPSLFLEVIDKMTMADRIKGNVRLNKLFDSPEGGKR